MGVPSGVAVDELLPPVFSDAPAAPTPLLLELLDIFADGDDVSDKDDSEDAVALAIDEEGGAAAASGATVAIGAAKAPAVGKALDDAPFFDRLSEPAPVHVLRIRAYCGGVGASSSSLLIVGARSASRPHLRRVAGGAGRLRFMGHGASRVDTYRVAVLASSPSAVRTSS